VTQNDSRQAQIDDGVGMQKIVQLLTISTAQLEHTMQDGEAATATLTGSFLEMTEELQALSGQLQLLQNSEPGQRALRHCALASDNIHQAVTAFQHFDRLQQRLEHVLLGLQNTLQLLEQPADQYQTGKWKKLQEELRSRYTMESEKILFDAILQGKSIAQAIELAASQGRADSENNEIELF